MQKHYAKVFCCDQVVTVQEQEGDLWTQTSSGVLRSWWKGVTNTSEEHQLTLRVIRHILPPHGEKGQQPGQGGRRGGSARRGGRGWFKGAQVWDFSSLRLQWFFCHKVFIGRGLEGWNEKIFFFKCGPDTYHFIFASICAVYSGTDFWLWVITGKVISNSFEVHLNVSK